MGSEKCIRDRFTENVNENHIIDYKKRPTVVKALCLHIAHDCNLACKYCFAEEGEYHGHRALMDYETGKQALEFLIANSGSRRNLEVDFFGGEPLMNFDVVKRLVAYGREQEKLHDKHFRFTLTTNGVLLDDDIMEAMKKFEQMEEVLCSLPGLDCGACGAPSCQGLAEDIVQGKAHEIDCIFKLRASVHKLSQGMLELAKQIPIYHEPKILNNTEDEDHEG